MTDPFALFAAIMAIANLIGWVWTAQRLDQVERRLHQSGTLLKTKEIQAE